MTSGSPTRRPAVSPVLQQHVDDAAILHSTRTALARAPHVKLHHLRRFDDRLAAHLEGLEVAGDDCKSMCEAALQLATPGAMFVAATRALASRDTAWMQRLSALSESIPECRSGLISAFGWAQRGQLQGIVAGYLRSTNAAERAIGVAACAVHRVDPGLGPANLLDDPDPRVRARAYRAAGELGKREFVSRLGAASVDEDAACAFWAACSAVLLGDRMAALDQLMAMAAQEGAYQARAFQLALLALPRDRGHEWLRSLSGDPALVRRLIKGAGLAGESTYVPWLMSHMSNDKLSRLAGESFSMITGADLAWLDLERKPPENLDVGPNDNPEDTNVAMDEDDGLPWPDEERVKHWWHANNSRFPPGGRYFVGAPVTRAHCVEVLKTGYQRQRILAALWLSLQSPGATLFEWRAPSWRQKDELATFE